MNLIANGKFAADSDWTKGAGWTISSGNATHAGGAGDLSQDLSANVNIGDVAYILFKVSGRTAGTLIPKAGTAAGGAVNADGTYSIKLTFAGNQNLVFSADADFDGSIGEVYLVKSTSGDFVNPDFGDGIKSGQRCDVTIVNVGDNDAHVAWSEGELIVAGKESMDFIPNESHGINGRRYTHFAILPDNPDGDCEVQITASAIQGVM